MGLQAQKKKRLLSHLDLLGKNLRNLSEIWEQQNLPVDSTKVEQLQIKALRQIDKEFLDKEDPGLDAPVYSIE